MDAPKVAAGGSLIAISWLLFVQAGAATPTPFSLAAVGAIGLSAIALLVGTVTA